MRRSPTARASVMLGVVLATGATLVLTLLIVRSIVVHQVDREANESIVQEINDFIAFAEGAEYVTEGEDQSSGSPDLAVYSSESELFERFFTQQTPREHQALVAVTGDETRVSDNVRDGAAERFAGSDALTEVLQSDQTSGIMDSDEFGEVRWGRVATDQDGAFVALHFVSDAESDAADAAWTFTWAGAGAMTLVGIVAWLISGPLFRTRRRTAVGPAQPPTTPSALVETGEDWSTAGELSLTRVAASSLLLQLRREALAEHPGRRIALAAAATTATTPTGSWTGDSVPANTMTADVLGALAQIEAELDVESVRSAMLDLVDQAMHQSSEADVVMLSGQRTAADRLRLAVSAPSQTPGSEAGSPCRGAAVETAFFAVPGHSSTSVPFPSRASAGMGAVSESAREAVEAHQGRWWVASEPGLTSWILELPLGPDDLGPADGGADEAPDDVGPHHTGATHPCPADNGAPARTAPVPQLSVSL